MIARPNQNTSWEKIAGWYQDLVGDGGHYFHRQVILPGVLRLLSLSAGDSLVDLACGQGVLARALPPETEYLGVDAAKSLIQSARQSDANPRHQYIVADATGRWSTPRQFSHAACVLALQNMARPEKLIINAASVLQENGRLVLVMNHPAFRIPRQSGWGLQEDKKLQYRWINRYLSPLKIPIVAHPGKKQSAVTWTFHWPLQDLFRWLHEADFVVEQLEEWVSDKSSQGAAAKMENRGRAEFPLFLALQVRKITS